MQEFQSTPAPAQVASEDESIPVAQIQAISILPEDRSPTVPQGIAPLAPKGNRFLQSWKKVGGGSLAISILIHAGILMVAGAIVFTTALQDKAVDFMPGGGSKLGQEASQALSHQVQQKKRNQVNKKVPKQRLVSTSLNAAISLPDAPPDLLDVPDVSSMFGSGAKMTSGFGGGFGGGFGAGTGLGSMSGITFQPITMFGKEIKDARRIAVVMDVSRSMTKYLPAVVSELDKIARQSVLVMHFGCGLSNSKGRTDDKVRKADGEDFATFWQNWQGKASLRLTPEERRKLKYDPSLPMPLEPIYKKLAGRGNTYYINFSGIAQTASALMSNEVMEADIIYWFADFQDAVSEDVMDSVRRKLRGRKQKLYMHASTRGRAFEQVVEGLVKPLGGEVIEAEVKAAK